MSDERIQRAAPELSAALNRIADALERLADVYLYVNEPEGEEGEPPQSLTLPDGFRGMR
jgi:hypothetical protein